MKTVRGEKQMTYETMQILSMERPVGTSANAGCNDYLEQQLLKMGFRVESLPFDCTVWEKGKSCLGLGEKEIEVAASPFSEAFDGAGALVPVYSADMLQKTDCAGKILLMSGELAETPLMPKGFPFYFPEEHEKLLALLEEKKPKAIIAATGKHPTCGLNPFPLFEDGNFPIPSAYISLQTLGEINAVLSSGKIVSLTIRSEKKKTRSRQLVAAKSAGDNRYKAVLCAHMDTKYGTNGALDNATGIAVLLETAKWLNADDCDVEIVPFNGEEYYEASGEVLYLKYREERNEPVSLLVNFDGPCFAGSKNAVSFYNFTNEAKETAIRLMAGYPDVVTGPEWYSGDHSAFAYRGIPCMAVTSNDLYEGALAYTHTYKDTPEIVDCALIKPTGKYVANLITLLLRSRVLHH